MLFDERNQSSFQRINVRYGQSGVLNSRGPRDWGEPARLLEDECGIQECFVERFVVLRLAQRFNNVGNDWMHASARVPGLDPYARTFKSFTSSSTLLMPLYSLINGSTASSSFVPAVSCSNIEP